MRNTIEIFFSGFLFRFIILGAEFKVEIRRDVIDLRFF